MKWTTFKFSIQIVTTLLTLTTSGFSLDTCKGGEGGTPLTNISKEFHFETKLLKTHGLVKEFLVHDEKKEIIYRDEDNHVWKSNQNGHQFLTGLDFPFSKIVDPWEQFVISIGSPWTIDTRNNRLLRLGRRSKKETDLFWNGSRVFSIEDQTYEKNTVWYNIHTLNGSTQRMGCTLAFPDNVEMHIGTGHSYPFLFFYTTEQLSGGIQVVKYALRLEAKKKLIGEYHRCEVTAIEKYTKLMPGKILGLHHFGDLSDPDNSAWLMEIDHPQKRMLWSYKEQCTYFNAPMKPVLIPNHDLPIVAMQKEGGGLTLIYPGQEKSVDMLEKVLTRPLTSENLWLSGDKRNLYVAAQPEQENARLLFKVVLDKVE